MSHWLLLYCVFMFAVHESTSGISSKMDFGDDDGETTVVTNSSQVTDEDVEVKHTIIVSTKLKNNNRRGIHSASDGDSEPLLQGRSDKPRKGDSSEVPVFRGYKAVETTQIRTPDSRVKTKMYPDSAFVNRNMGDEFDIHPNPAPTNHWQPSTFYNNVNWWSPDDRLVTYNIDRNADRTPAYRGTGKFHRRITDDGMKEFYCCKCRELIRGSRGAQGRANPLNYETTTKVKIDGKLAKLN